MGKKAASTQASMLACMSLDQQYSETCKEVKQPVNPFIKRILQEVKLHDEVLAKRITVKIAGNNRLIPVQKVTDSDFQILASVFMNNVFLTGLDLRYNLLTDAGAAHIAAFIQDNRTLLYLNLMFNDIGTLGAEFIAKAMHRNETLCYLRMTGNKIENKGGMYFAAMIQVNNTIQKLDFGDCDLGTQSMIALATVLNHNESIKALNLNRPILYSEEEETTIHIASMLRVNCTLVELHLCKHGMKNFGIERLCDALYDNSTLRYLDLSCNKISRDGMKFLGQLLKQNTTLEIVDLNFNRIENDGAFYLSDALATYNRTLQALAVTYNNISGPGLVAFSEAMKINPVLSYIYIWGNKFDEDACVAFAELLESGRLKPTGTDVEPYKVDGRVYLAELSHGLKRHYYWTPSYGDPDNEVENASLAINPVSEHL
ncbi:leucine-rich repeat-containing protein 34 isoform X2 [Pantherophis guttatus]|uniref:Leucine-rich repeat-containing protein 34 isoform X2 n=1 Tax=Pantherophis guttatus TaxID=94885 RepID=A0A6P9DGS5_PANGU|nr:leucine-rich repeat-containing protein 34 isoform X2 [Pantherophis guttatus]